MVEAPEGSVEVVGSLAKAKVGDTVWHWARERDHKNAAGKYRRGGWVKASIEAETRQSFSVLGLKFDRKTGVARPYNGWTFSQVICGLAEKEEREWLGKAPLIGDSVSRIRDVPLLRRVAEMIGWEEPSNG